jgi:beta-glucanase (GH16 family)
MKSAVLTTILLASVWTSGCGKNSGSLGCGEACGPATAAPTISTTNAQNGAVIVSLADTASGATIFYTVDGTTPTSSSQQYQAPFLVASNLTVKALAIASGIPSVVSVQAFALNIPSGMLVWSDEFTNTTGVNAQPDPSIWTYDTGATGWGNSELETYCAWNSSTAPCSTASPNAYVDPSGFLHIVALSVGNQQYTSARMKTQGLFSFQYGRLEFSAKVPEEQGLWPANWTLGNNIATVSWPACGEQDVLERVDNPGNPDWNEGSVHGPGFTGPTGLGLKYFFTPPATAGNGFHRYEMDWSPGSVSYYIDDPTHLNPPYATFTPANVPAGGVWPFDSGQSNFIILNLAVGGTYPGNPDGTTTFPAEMQIDYVRIYTN